MTEKEDKEFFDRLNKIVAIALDPNVGEGEAGAAVNRLRNMITQSRWHASEYRLAGPDDPEQRLRRLEALAKAEADKPRATMKMLDDMAAEVKRVTRNHAAQQKRHAEATQKMTAEIAALNAEISRLKAITLVDKDEMRRQEMATKLSVGSYALSLVPTICGWGRGGVQNDWVRKALPIGQMFTIGKRNLLRTADSTVQVS